MSNMQIYGVGLSTAVKGCVAFDLKGYRISASNIFYPTECRIFKGMNDVTVDVLTKYGSTIKYCSTISRNSDGSPSIPSATIEGLVLCQEAINWIVPIEERSAHDDVSFEHARRIMEKE